jgi:hypothetical protein
MPIEVRKRRNPSAMSNVEQVLTPKHYVCEKF